MDGPSPPGHDHDVFLKWAGNQGVKSVNVSPARFPGRGLGIKADGKIRAGETLLFVPTSTLLSVSSVPRPIVKAIGKITVHGLLAAVLTIDAAGPGAVSWPGWRAVWPSKQDFQESMPLLWKREIQDLLPPAAKDLLQGQQRKLAKDFATVARAYPNLDEHDYRYHWLVINTRTFYYVAPGAKKKPPAADCMALCPYADYFNHAGRGCPVTFQPDGFTITADRDHEAGEELYISYGGHSNDFLLAEYGFILDGNEWDSFQLDHLMLPQLSEQQKDRLKHEGYLGNYVFDGTTVCHRTRVAIRLPLLPVKEWHRFVNGEHDGQSEEVKVDELVTSLVKAHEEQAKAALETLQHVSSNLSGHALLIRRWKQILKGLGPRPYVD